MLPGRKEFARIPCSLTILISVHKEQLIPAGTSQTLESSTLHTQNYCQETVTGFLRFGNQILQTRHSVTTGSQTTDQHIT